MQNQVFGAECQGALDLAAKRHDALLTKLGRLAADVDQVAGMNHERADVVFSADSPHALGLLRVDLLRPPHPRTRRKDLQCIRADLVRPIDRIGGTARRAEVNSDSLCHFKILIGEVRLASSAIPLGAQVSCLRPGKPSITFA